MADHEDQAKGARAHPGMMGDGTEEQNLGQKGDPGARITKDEVEDAFGKADAPEADAPETNAPKGDAPKK